MKRLSSAAGLALAIVAALELAGPVTAGEQVPFKGRLEGDVTRTLDPPVVLVDVDATGNATGLGRFTLDIPHVVDPATRTAVGSYSSPRPTAIRSTPSSPGRPLRRRFPASSTSRRR
jgi:hypothetical protein